MECSKFGLKMDYKAYFHCHRLRNKFRLNYTYTVTTFSFGGLEITTELYELYRKDAALFAAIVSRLPGWSPS